MFAIPAKHPEEPKPIQGKAEAAPFHIHSLAARQLRAFIGLMG
jgi:hypothetical protein